MSRRVRNGRSPLVSKQSQITAFFASPKTPKSSQTLTPNSTTPNTSSFSPHLPECSRSRSAVGKKVRVFWPLDGKWYDGRVTSFNETGGKHTVKYDDGDVEDLDLKSEKIEWVEEKPVSLQRLNRNVSLSGGDLTLEEEKTPVCRISSLARCDDSEAKKEETRVSFRRLRRMPSLGDSPVEKKTPITPSRMKKLFPCVSGGDSTVEDVDASPMKVSVCNDDDDDDDDNSVQDEDWGKEISDDDEMEIELEEEEEFGGGKKMKSSGSTMKRRKREVVKVDSSVKKKAKVDGSCGKMFSSPMILTKNIPDCEAVGYIIRDGGKVMFSSPLAPVTTMRKSLERVCIIDNASVLHGDVAERFGKRETEKFQFLHERRKDAKGMHPGHVNYDPKTIFLPQEFLKSLSGGQRQWWEFKSKHMDKVLFFKMGKFYELFEMDAHVGAKELDLQYMKGEQPHCGFPEKNFSVNLEKLVRKGYRVLVIEQTETPDQLELRRKEMGSKDKVVKREICAVVTMGTLTDVELLSTNPDASYLMSLTEGCLDDHEGIIVMGVCVVDVSTNKFMLGQFEDDSERQCLCSLLSELRPVEIIKPLKILSTETEKVLQKYTRNPLFNDLIPNTEFWNAEKTVFEIRNTYQLMGKDIRQLPDVLSGLISDVENGKYALSAFGGSIFYLRQSLLDESLLRCAKFESLPRSNFCTALEKEYVILDAAALESLEILENNRNGSQSGTLFAQLNHCVTAFGKRLLKSWLVRPLYNKGLIVERQDAVAGLKVSSSALEFRKDISRLPDMERLLARLFLSYEASGRNASKVVLYEDASKKKLREFTAALRGCESMVNACSSLQNLLKDKNSSLLHHLLTPGKGFPDVLSDLKYFKDAFDWADADQTGRVIPHAGGDLEYDSVCKTIKEIQLNLKNYLKEQHKLLKDTSINYVTIGKDSYLLELPEKLKSKIPRDYELQSSKKGYFRYWTPKIKKFLVELAQAEAEKETILKSILHRLIGRFSEHHIEWRQLVSTVAEIDVLISMSIASNYYEGPSCRPTITAASCSDECTPSLSAKSLGHPLLQSDTLGKGSFVPNDVSIGGGHSSFILLTGPNMGGKSTLLRQICLAVILAQIGADVPAESFELSLVDRIFVRMGAKDHIMAGQSTFLTELSETASMLSSATQNSIVALDELGRGTSTSDGQAIAESVLEFFIHTVGCRGMFSTHYHRLALEYERNPKVSLCHMACQVGKGVDGVEEVTFLYRLIGGSCPKSYGVNVARLAGLPASVLKKSMAKSRQFELVYGNEKHGATDKNSLNIIGNDGVALLKEIFRISFTTTTDGVKKSESTAFTWLNQLQQRAKLLVEQV